MLINEGMTPVQIISLIEKLGFQLTKETKEKILSAIEDFKRENFYKILKSIENDQNFEHGGEVLSLVKDESIHFQRKLSLYLFVIDKNNFNYTVDYLIEPNLKKLNEIVESIGCEASPIDYENPHHPYIIQSKREMKVI